MACEKNKIVSTHQRSMVYEVVRSADRKQAGFLAARERKKERQNASTLFCWLVSKHTQTRLPKAVPILKRPELRAVTSSGRTTKTDPKKKPGRFKPPSSAHRERKRFVLPSPSHPRHDFSRSHSPLCVSEPLRDFISSDANCTRPPSAALPSQLHWLITSQQTDK